MPAVSKKQQELFAIAEHEPSKLHKENQGMLKVGKEKLSEFASTKRKGLPESKSRLGKRSEVSK